MPRVMWQDICIRSEIELTWAISEQRARYRRETEEVTNKKSSFNGSKGGDIYHRYQWSSQKGLEPTQMRWPALRKRRSCLLPQIRSAEFGSTVPPGAADRKIWTAFLYYWQTSYLRLIDRNSSQTRSVPHLHYGPGMKLTKLLLEVVEVPMNVQNNRSRRSEGMIGPKSVVHVLAKGSVCKFISTKVITSQVTSIYHASPHI